MLWCVDDWVRAQFISTLEFTRISLLLLQDTKNSQGMTRMEEQPAAIKDVIMWRNLGMQFALKIAQNVLVLYWARKCEFIKKTFVKC
jgi:hypothetical protein